MQPEMAAAFKGKGEGRGIINVGRYLSAVSALQFGGQAI